MIIKATDIKNHFGKYIKLLVQEDIIVTKNGSPVAKIVHQADWGPESTVREETAAYEYHGRKMSFEEFMEMYEKTDERYEYVDGEVFRMDSPRITHQRVLGNLHVSMRQWFKGKPCMPYLSPFDVILKKDGQDMNLVQPDLLVVCDGENRNRRDKYTGTPALVVEILSDSSVRMDLVRKLDLYMRSGVREYWIVHCGNREVSVYFFEDNNIADMKLFVKEGAVRSFHFNGLEISMDDIFE